MVEAGQVGLKDLATGDQTPVPLDGAVDAVVAALGQIVSCKSAPPRSKASTRRWSD